MRKDARLRCGGPAPRKLRAPALAALGRLTILRTARGREINLEICQLVNLLGPRKFPKGAFQTLPEVAPRTTLVFPTQLGFAFASRQKPSLGRLAGHCMSSSARFIRLLGAFEKHTALTGHMV